MKRNEKWKLNKILSCRFEEKSQKIKRQIFAEWIVFFAARISEEKPRERNFFEDLSPRFKVHFVCFYRRESLFWNGDLFAKKKLTRGEKTKPQTAMVITLWFWALVMCTELYGDWSLHNQHFSGINDFLSQTAKLLKTLCLRHLVRKWYLKSLGG